MLRFLRACPVVSQGRGGAPEAHGERASHTDSGVSPGWEKGGWARATAQPEQQCLAFPFLSRKEQKKNCGEGRPQ